MIKKNDSRKINLSLNYKIKELGFNQRKLFLILKRFNSNLNILIL